MSSGAHKSSDRHKHDDYEDKYDDLEDKYDDLEDEVDDLVHEYKHIKKPHPVLCEPLDNPDGFTLLWEVIENHISLIKSRSQAFEDAHITVYDRALLILTKNGKDITNVGALELYLEEFVGIPLKGSVARQKDVLDKHVALKSLLTKISQSDKDNNPRTNDNVAFSSLPSRYGYGRRHERETKSRSSESTGDANIDEKIQRIINIYFKAKDEYYALGDTDYAGKLDVVRFLRDTAENSMNYLCSHGLGEHSLVPELKQTFEMAKGKATLLSGGRKRRFEILEEDRGRIFTPGYPRNKYPYERYGPGPKYPRLGGGDYYRPFPKA